MTALTATALALWAFQPFDRIQDATRFMDSLPATACAQVSYGPAQSDEEQAEREAARVQRAKEREAKKTAYIACKKFSESQGAIVSNNTPTAKVPGGRGWKHFESYSSPYLGTHGEVPKNLWVPDCGYDPDMVVISTLDGYMLTNRWVVIYRKESKP
jgi:hypothetical protein